VTSWKTCIISSSSCKTFVISHGCLVFFYNFNFVNLCLTHVKNAFTWKLESSAV
jgi:hypothetical protein